MTSSTGLAGSWQSRTAPASLVYRTSVWAPELGLLHAAAQGGGTMWSADGIAWTAGTTYTAEAWIGTAWSPSLGVAVMVASSGHCRSSTDMLTWTSRTIPAGTYIDVTWSERLGLFIACGVNRIATSPNGVDWTSRTPPAAVTWNSVADSPLLGVSMMVANSGEVARSEDGIAWEIVTDTGSHAWQSITWCPGDARFFGVSLTGDAVFTSVDGSSVVAVGADVNAWDAAWSQDLQRLVATGTGVAYHFPNE
jgi:hypothetical protein